MGGKPTNQEVIWTSSNDNVAKVDESGKVIAVGSGVATITATSVGLSPNMEKPASSSCIVTVQGIEGNYIYQLKEDGTVKINKYLGNEKDVIVPSTIDGKQVTEIDTYKFGDDTVTSIVILEGVTRIGKEAFNDSKNLKSVKLPSTLKEIDNNAFRKCSFEEIILPDNITSIGSNAFQDIPVIKAKKGTTTANTLKAKGLPFTDLVYPSSIQIGPQTKILDQGKSVQLQVTAYSGNSTNHDVTWSTSDAKIATVDDKGNVVAVGPGEVTITATAIGNAPNTDKPTQASMTITVRGVEGNYIYIVKNREAQIEQYIGKEIDVVIPSTLGNYKVTALGAHSLWMNKEMQTVVIPEGVKKIGKYAFNGNSSITKIKLPSTIRTIEERAFYGTAITEMAIPEGVTSLGNEAFSNCKQLTSLTLPNTLTRFGHNMFSHCDSLIALYLPNHITSLGTNTFAGVAGTLYVHKDSKTEATLKKANIDYKYYFDLGLVNQAPTIQAKDQTIVIGSEFDPMKGVSAMDAEGGDLRIRFLIRVMWIEIKWVPMK